MISQESFDQLRKELSVKAKNGLDFTLAATIIWAAIAFLWTLEFRPYDKAVLTFIVGSVMLPLALGLSKVLKTTWKIKENPLQPLGLWLNFAQLFYFPFLIFVLLRSPEYFVMTYAIITGAHFFPYAWYYKTSLYAIFAGIIAIGAMFIGLNATPENMYLIPAGMSGCLALLTGLLYLDFKKR